MAQVNVKKTTSLLFVMRVIKLLISVVTITVTAKYFGVSMERDMWVLSSSVIATVTTSLWGPLNEIFRTKFVFIKESEGAEIARRKTASLVGFIIWFSLFIGLVIIFFAKPLANLLSSTVSAEGLDVLYKLAVLLIPSILIRELSNICGSILNAYNIFYIPEIVGWITGVVSIFVIMLLAPIIGIYSLLISSYANVILLFLVLLYFLNKNHIYIWDHIFEFQFSDVWQYIVFACPFFFPYVVGQMNVVAEKVLSGMVGVGGISSLDYSRQFAAHIQSVLSSVLLTVMVPLLAKAFVNNNHDGYNKILKDNIQTCFLILGAALGLLIGATDLVCALFFKTERISLEAFETIVRLARLYGLALIGVVFYVIFGAVLLSSNKRKLYATIGVFVQILVLLLYVTLFKFIGSLVVFPISYGLVHLIAGIIMYAKGSVLNHKKLAYIISKSLLSVGIVASLVYSVVMFLNPMDTILGLAYAGFALIISLPILLLGNGLSPRSFFVVSVKQFHKYFDFTK